MTCAEFDEIVEAVAAGDVTESAEVRAHRETCARCAGAYAVAVGIERALAAREVAAAPARFNAMVLMRIRNERWRTDQQVDRMFNAAVIVGVLAILTGGVALLNLGSVTAGIVSFAGFVANAASQSRPAAPESIPLWSYAAGCTLLAVSVMIWRWAENPRGPDVTAPYRQ